MIDFKFILLIGSSTARGFGLNSDESYLSKIAQSVPSVSTVNLTKDLRDISDILAILHKYQEHTDATVLIIHSAADSFFIPTSVLFSILRFKSSNNPLLMENNGYAIYKAMSTWKKSFLIASRLVKPNTSFLKLIRSYRLLKKFSNTFKHIFVIVDSGIPKFSPEWIIRSYYSRVIQFLFSNSHNISVIDFEKLSKKSIFKQATLYQSDGWHLNHIGHRIIAIEIIHRLNDLS